MRQVPAEWNAAIAAELISREFTHIPGPNPILEPGPPGAWDDRIIEAADVFRDHDTYYLFYHGASAQSGYQLGLATATHPLGPWTKHGAAPVLAPGAPGEWDSHSVACALVLKEGADKYYMWYSAHALTAPGQVGAGYHVGLATAQSPLGPWVRHPANPIVPGFGYVGGVVKVDGAYRMYNEHPIGASGPDYGPISLATAPSPEGPWTVQPEPVLLPGEPGEWDDGGFSEAKVTHQDGIYHLFYGGAKLHPKRLSSKESIGYAFSLDGRRFVKHRDNPVVARERVPDAAAFAEVHSCFEPPFVYLFHTLRYVSRPSDEHLGVEVLATQRPFGLHVPVLRRGVLASGDLTALADGPALACEHIRRVSLDLRCSYGAEARRGLRLLARSSADGLTYDTEDLAGFEVACRPGQTVQGTFRVDPAGRFLKLLVANPDPACEVRNLSVGATLHG